MLLVALLVVVAAVAAQGDAAGTNSTLYVCQAGDPSFLGTYRKSADKVLDGAPVYTNEFDMSFFRSRNYWYAPTLSTYNERSNDCTCC